MKKIGFIKSSFSWLKDNGVLSLFLTICTILLGLLISEVQTKIGLKSLIISLVFVNIIILSVLFMMQRPIVVTLKSYLDDFQESIESKSISWLKNTEQLARYELENNNFKEIWLITSDLLDDSQGGPFQTVVAANLRKGVKYFYFVPNTLEINARVLRLQKIYTAPKNLKFIYLPDSFFFLVPKLDIAIYNPVDGNDKSAFLGIPNSSDPNHYHAQVSTDFVDKLVGYLSKNTDYIKSKKIN